MQGKRGKVKNFDNLMFDVGRGVSQFPTLSERRKSFFPRVATDPQSLKREEREKSLISTGKTHMQVALESKSEVHGFIVTGNKPTWVIGLTKTVQDRGLAELG